MLFWELFAPRLSRDVMFFAIKNESGNSNRIRRRHDANGGWDFPPFCALERRPGVIWTKLGSPMGGENGIKPRRRNSFWECFVESFGGCIFWLILKCYLDVAGRLLHYFLTCFQIVVCFLWKMSHPCKVPQIPLERKVGRLWMRGKRRPGRRKPTCQKRP